MKRYIAILLAGLLCLSFAVCEATIKNLQRDKYTEYVGEINVIDGACDDEFDIKSDRLLLVRKIEMYQNIADENGNVYMDYSDKAHVIDNDTNGDYWNPQLPDICSVKVFTGSASIGDGNVLSNEMLNMFDNSDNSTLEKSYLIKVAQLPIDKEIIDSQGYKWYNSGSDLKSINSIEPQLGELRITYYYAVPVGEFKVIGYNDNGVIKGDIFDKDISVKDYLDSNAVGKICYGYFLLPCGAVMSALGVALIIRTKRKN